MFFPWVGMFEQVKLADVFVHYDDVQLPQGRSFTNRVQIKTKDGIHWLTVPLQRSEGKVNINEARLVDREHWRAKHLRFLEANYTNALYAKDMLRLVREV